MKIFGIQSIDVRGLPNGTYTFARGAEDAHDRVLITGGPGSGKTRLLELIVAAREIISPTDEGIDHEPFIRRENLTSKAIVSWALTSEEQATIGAATGVISSEIIFGGGSSTDPFDPGLVYLLERYAHDDVTPKIEYFSERRRLDLGGRPSPIDEDAQRKLRTTASPRKFAWVEAFMASLRESPERETRFATALDGLSPSAGYDLALHALFSRGRALRNLGELSASEADAILFAATAALVGLSRSIVLVDRPELFGLDPIAALSGLAALGEDNQLIVASSSPALVAAFDGPVIALDPNAPPHRGLG